MGRRMERCGWVITCVVLMVCAGLTASAVGSGSVGGWADRTPCLGAKCTQLNTHHHSGKDVENSATKGDAPPLVLPGRSPRVRRQTVVVEVGEGERSHRVECTESEEQQAACLKGECYALDMGELRSPFCQCPAMYEGPRCELLSTYYFQNYYAQLRKGAIIGGVVIGIILIIVAASVYCSYRKGKKKRKEQKKKPDSWDTATSKPETSAMMADGESQV